MYATPRCQDSFALPLHNTLTSSIHWKSQATWHSWGNTKVWAKKGEGSETFTTGFIERRKWSLRSLPLELIYEPHAPTTETFSQKIGRFSKRNDGIAKMVSLFSRVFCPAGGLNKMVGRTEGDFCFKGKGLCMKDLLLNPLSLPRTHPVLVPLNHATCYSRTERTRYRKRQSPRSSVADVPFTNWTTTWPDLPTSTVALKGPSGNFGPNHNKGKGGKRKKIQKTKTQGKTN